MQINYSKIIEIHGSDMLEPIKNNLEHIVCNINYLKMLQFDDIEDIFERYPQIFICSRNVFKEKINKFTSLLGINYVEILGNNMELWEELL